MRIDYYIGNFLKYCKKEDIIGIIMTETLNDDVKKIFNINILRHSKENKEKYNKKLSQLGYCNLRRYLKMDYKCIERLFELDCILEKQYNILMK